MSQQNFLSNITGSFAMPAAENPTVAMIEAAYQHHKLDWRYLNCEVPPENLADAVKGARAMGWKGFNCSLPHKVNVIQYLDGLGESASIIGAVNCVVKRGDKYIGENTDGKGFLKSLEAVTNPKGKSIVLFGAGGAARAIGVEVALAGAAHITLVNRDTTRGQQVVDLLNAKTRTKTSFVQWNNTFHVPSNIDVVINATSIGLDDAHAALNVDMSTVKPNMVVADVIPNPPRTKLVRDAQTIGCTVIDGLGMLVNQGVTGVKYWTDEDVSPDVMHKKLRDIFGA